jgi:hypothetical protein
MESKKINQLATELTPALDDLTIIGDPTTGISKKITLSQMASLFTGTVEEYANLAAFPLVGVADTIYIALDTNVLYRWNTGTNAYVELSPNIINSLVFSDANGFDGNISLVGSTATLTITTALTTGSVPFIGASGALSQDNANLFFDDTNNRLGINTNAPTTALDVFGSGIIGRINGTSTNNAFLGFASAGTNRWSIGNVQSDNRFRIYNDATTSELISLLSTGEFGIGISNPTTKVHIDGGSSALIANLDANVSVAKSISFRSDNSNRINLEVSGTESGSNAGADFFIRRYSDAGSLIDTPLTIIRSTGNATFSGILTTPQVKAATSAGLSINANSGTQVADFGAGGSANITFFGGLNGTSATFSGALSATTGAFTGNVSITTTSSTLTLKATNTAAGGSLIFRGTLTGGAEQFQGFIAAVPLDSNNNTSDLSFNTYNVGSIVEGMRIKSNGNVGIGVTPAAWSGVKALQIGDYSALFDNSSFTILSNNVYYNAGNKYINAAKASQIYLNAGNIVFEVNNTTGTAGNTISFTEAMRISSGGNVGIGTSSPSGAAGLAFVLNSGASQGRICIKTSTTGDASGDGLQIGMSGNDAFIEQRENAALSFATNASERMRITSAGDVGIGTTNVTGKLVVSADDTQYVLRSQNSSGGNPNQFFIQHNFGNVIIGNDRGTVTYGNPSDYRLKEDLKDYNALNIISKLKTYNFKWIQSGISDYGVIAHEMQEILPNYVTRQKDAINEDGTIQAQSVDYSKIVPILVKAIQELKAEIEILKLK